MVFLPTLDKQGNMTAVQLALSFTNVVLSSIPSTGTWDSLSLSGWTDGPSPEYSFFFQAELLH